MVSVIVVSYNTKKLLESCLSSLYKYLKTLNFELIVVDNASVDGSIEMVRSKFKEAILIENDTNLGFAKANNTASKVAKGQYLIFLNSDTQLLDNGIAEMIELLREEESLGVLGGVLENENKTIQKSFGSFYSVWTVVKILFFGKQRENMISVMQKTQLVDWVSGGFMAVKSDLFGKLEGFDEHFFMYVEDMEFCFRVHRLGMRVKYFPSARVVHVGQGSSSRTFAIVNIYAGISYFFLKHKSMVEYYVVRLFLICKAIIAIAIGHITRDTYLISTYKRSLNVL